MLLIRGWSGPRYRNWVFHALIDALLTERR